MNNVSSLRRRVTYATLATLLAAALLIVPTIGSAASTPSWSGPRPTIVLVHGAWADGSSWSEVSERLLREGFDVRVPPNNLRGVATDAPDLSNYLATIDGPIVLVAHSYGGMVVTNAARGNDQVRALVYVDAFIPQEGDTLLELNQPPGIFAQDPNNVFDFVPYTGAPEGAVDTYVKASVYGEAFAEKGLRDREIEVLTAAQRPLATPAFGMASGAPAWAEIRSWAVVGTQDKIIPAKAQRAMATAAGATITELNAPHLSMLTHDQAVTRVIVRAAQGGHR